MLTFTTGGAEGSTIAASFDPATDLIMINQHGEYAISITNSSLIATSKTAPTLVRVPAGTPMPASAPLAPPAVVYSFPTPFTSALEGNLPKDILESRLKDTPDNMYPTDRECQTLQAIGPTIKIGMTYADVNRLIGFDPMTKSKVDAAGFKPGYLWWYIGLTDRCNVNLYVKFGLNGRVIEAPDVKDRSPIAVRIVR